MKVLVTGCNGYIGAHTVKQLAERGHTIYGIDQKWGNDVQEYLTDYVHNDICDHRAFTRIIHRDIFPGAVIHLAASIKVGESVEQPAEYYHNNIYGTKCALEFSQGAKFIFASTGAAFGGESPYAISKIAAEHIVKQQADEYTIFRFFNVAGNGEFKNFNKDGLLECLRASNESFTINGDNYDTKDGTPIRDYIHVEDIATSICNAVEQPAANTDYECLGYGKEYSVKEVAEAYKRENNAKFDIIIGDRRDGDLASCAVPSVSKFVEQNYTLEEIVRG